MPDDLELTEEPTEFEVLPENWPALEIFLDCSTQWKHAPMGGPTGLDYPALKMVMEFHAVAPTEFRERFGQVRLLERGALNEMAGVKRDTSARDRAANERRNAQRHQIDESLGKLERLVYHTDEFQA
ncbi:DUF1799 domain-containing protein [Salinicola sp. JS01]|uniref:DUF1799 domain-containing protein n=1 Tax=Salinicola sp. JS01 TaxID=3050071 RepID=UPI00255B5018|nr:DUF1799 domain-containing protein [Salinicola sp. JS01]WIX31252.1 DUF1799 domain-containing protein [Salinicola sp. JS01]